MRIIVTGASHEIDFVQRLCRDKVRRGMISILPATSPACDNEILKENVILKERIKELESQLKTIPEIIETVPSDSASVEDTKNIDVEDMTEVNLDDVKVAPAEDTKMEHAVTPKKTRKSRSKQSE